MIKFEQSQALTSHFESFWSIVHTVRTYILNFQRTRTWVPFLQADFAEWK